MIVVQSCCALRFEKVPNRDGDDCKSYLRETNAKVLNYLKIYPGSAAPLGP